ncbi:P-loop NTPase family protein [Sapientia aquatica]|uniref:Flp pilus assembly complex ATPase component TadA n=1 Tax=Sapientia aquatica TaxID=1549640 RepID=UPI001404E92D|nr:Flp pilus assembly complex ATPase component TadA [Sapientia aquatica]
MIKCRYEITACWCGKNTELFDSKQQIYQEGYHPDSDPVSLSARYCSDHRPKYVGRKNINARYLSALNNNTDFEKELLRLELQCSSISEARAQSGDPDLDLFYLRIIAAKATFGDEESVLKNLARNLIDRRIDDTKKRIVMLSAKGKTQEEIASLVGMNSRQTVSKALASVPSEYRFDRPKKSDQTSKTTANQLSIEQVTNGLGELVVSALNDPNTYEVYLNCDGSLWVEMAKNESHKIGTIPSEQADKLVQCMARSQNIELSEKNPIVSGDLPINDARFTVMLPPVVKNPSFCIRKRRS